VIEIRRADFHDFRAVNGWGALKGYEQRRNESFSAPERASLGAKRRRDF